MNLTKWMADKTEYLDERIEEMEDAYETLGGSLYAVRPDHLIELLTEDSDTYLINQLYKLAEGDIDDLGYQLQKMLYKTAIFSEFVSKLMELLECMAEVEDEIKQNHHAQTVNHITASINEEAVCDNEHY